MGESLALASERTVAPPGLAAGLRLPGSGQFEVAVTQRVETLLADRLVAMDLGRVIADGPPAEVVRHTAVVTSYLGRGIDRAIVPIGGHSRTPGQP